MNFKTFRDRLSLLAIVSGVCFLVFGLLFNYYFFLRPFSIRLFWILFFVTILLAVLSFPRWKSFVVFALSIAILCLSFGRAPATYYLTIPSPDGKYQLVVYSVPMLFAMPGGGSDAPCYVQLQNKSGKILNEGYLEMVQLLDRIDWEKDSVTVAITHTWSLPE